MKLLRKTLKITGITLLVILALAFIMPFAFKKQITSLVKKEINNSINAKVDFADVSLSLFRHFPKVTIGIKNLSVIGVQDFEGDTLLYTKSFDATANLISVIKGKDIKVHGVYLSSPSLHALVNKEGKANWDIAKASTNENNADTSSSSFKMTLKEYSITDGYIAYTDKSSNINTIWKNVDHTGSGDFTQDEFTLSTNTHAKQATIIYETIPYLNNTETTIDADIKINTKTNTYTFKTDDVVLNDLKLSAEGFFQLANDSTYNMDIKFASPTNEFKNILSLIPAVYKQDFDKIKTSGEAVFNGFVKGTYSPTQIPAYDVKLGVKNGFFQYPDLPKPVKNIQLDLHASNIDGQPDNTVIDISKGHLEMDNEPFDFKLLFKNPETAKYIDAVAKGKLDLSQLSQFIKLDNGTKLAGNIAVDAYVKGNMSAIETMQGPFAAGGFFDVRNLFYASNDFPQPISNGNMNIRIDNQGGIADKTLINISNGHIEVGKDPVDFSLQVSNPVTIVNFSGDAKGRFTLDNAKQFTMFEPGTTLSGILNAAIKFAGNQTMINKGEYDKINIGGNADISNLKYVAKDYPSGINVSNIAAAFNPSNITISKYNGNYLGSNFSGNGSLNNLINFMLKDEPLSGNVRVTVDKMNLNDWMGTDENASMETSPASTTTSTPFLVPANMNISLAANAGEVLYDKVSYKNISGNLLLQNETVTLQNVKANALDGEVILNGGYSTKTDKTNPNINLSYVIKDMDVQKTFLSFNTIRALMPIGKFLSGKLNSELTLSGSLKGDMMPELKSLTGKGNLLLIQGVLKKFVPLEKIASELQIEKLQSITVKDIKNYIEFTNGRVLVKPFPLKIDDIALQIGGMHGIDQSLEYIVDMRLPRSYLGAKGNSMVNGLVTQAANKGVPIKLGEMVDLNIKVTGSLTNPVLKMDLKQVAGDAMADLKKQAADFAKEKVDSMKVVVKDTIQKVTEKLKDTLKQKALDKIFGKDTTGGGNNPADTTNKKPAYKIKSTLKDILNRNKKQKKDTAQ